jgi:hypothetical protein
MNDAVRRSRQPLLPWRKPWWLLVVAAMILAGYGQTWGKSQLNCYMQALRENPQLNAMEPEQRALFWMKNTPRLTVMKVDYYENQNPWPLLHHASFKTLWIVKWTLALGIVVLFFSLDALFLKVADAWHLRAALATIYLIVCAMMGLFLSLAPGEFAPGEGGYDVATELLGFLQSPLPSFMLVFVRWLHARGRPPASTTPA